MNKTQKQKLNELTDRALMKWGKTGQGVKCIEELAELQEVFLRLQKALCKNILGLRDDSDLAEEIDCEIMLHQMKRIYGLGNKVDGVIAEKLYSLELRIGRG